MSQQLVLQSFLAVYRTGSQTKAAEELSLTQPAISQHIKIIEQYAKRPLFKKIGKQLYPTPLAHQLAFSISSHIDALDTIWTGLKPLSKKLGCTVYLGGIAEFFSTVIAPHLAKLSKYNIHLRFEIGHDALLELLLHGELDLAQFCTHVVHPGITVEQLFHQQYYLVGAPKWKKEISITALEKGNTECINRLPWIAYDESLLFIKEYYQSVFNKQFEGPVSLMVKDLWSIQSATIGGLGITVLPSYFCEKFLKNKQLTLLYRPEKHPNHYFYLGWKDGALLNPHVKTLREIILEAATKKTSSLVLN